MALAWAARRGAKSVIICGRRRGVLGRSIKDGAELRELLLWVLPPLGGLALPARVHRRLDALEVVFKGGAPLGRALEPRESMSFDIGGQPLLASRHEAWCDAAA